MAEQEEAVRRSAVSWEETKGFLIIGLVGIQTIVCWGRRGTFYFWPPLAISAGDVPQLCHRCSSEPPGCPRLSTIQKHCE